VPRQIIISATPQESRVAIMENARLLEIHIERVRERGIVGSIYKGRVTRVLPGMQAAFVDIGLPKAAFLPASDHYPADADELTLAEVPLLPQNDGTSDPELTAEGLAVRANGSSVPNRKVPPIEERLSKGQEVTVQISKEPIGSKGARVTSNISLPGRYLVYLPASSHVGVSRRIASEDERDRLRDAVGSASRNPGGIIIRTACEGVSKREIQADLRLLRKLWMQLARRAEKMPAPALLHQDLDVILRTIRDLSGSDVARLIIDNRRDHQRVLDFIATVMPRWHPRVELYDLPEPIFERYGIEAQIGKAVERRVWLKSGGHIIIDHAEAMTVVDVNTGRFVGKTDQRETTLRTNLEAARVIVDQLRLRNIGGLIVIDFIDMEHAEDRKTVMSALLDALKSDKARAHVLGFSELGLVEMTRQRTRESLAQQLCEPCPTCSGKGHVKGTATTAYEILRRIRREASLNAPVHHITVSLHPSVATFIAQYEPAALREIERELGVEVSIHRVENLDPTQYEVTVATAVPGIG
jgi:ribonuclease G